MPDFNSIFPHFTERCGELKQLLTPIAYLLMVGGLISSTIAVHRSGREHMRLFGRTIVFITILTFLVPWGNSITTIVDSTVRDVLKVDPAKVYDQYQQALQMRKATEENRSWWEKVFELRASMFEALLSALLWLLGWIASAIVFYAYVLQKVILFMGYALSPLFIGFLAFGGLFETGKRYLLHLVGVMLWPLGWGVAGLVTEGLIDFMTDRSFLHSSFVGAEAYTFQNFIGVALLAIWLIFSTIAAPVILEKSLWGGAVVGAALLGGAVATGRAALQSGMIAGTAVGASGGGGGAILGGIATGAAAAAESLSGMSSGTGGTSIIGALGSMRPFGSSAQRRASRKVADPPFPVNDLTGDKTVAEMLRRSRNPYARRRS